MARSVNTNNSTLLFNKKYATTEIFEALSKYSEKYTWHLFIGFCRPTMTQKRPFVPWWELKSIIAFHSIAQCPTEAKGRFCVSSHVSCRAAFSRISIDRLTIPRVKLHFQNATRWFHSWWRSFPTSQSSTWPTPNTRFSPPHYSCLTVSSCSQLFYSQKFFRVSNIKFISIGRVGLKETHKIAHQQTVIIGALRTKIMQRGENPFPLLSKVRNFRLFSILPYRL